MNKQISKSEVLDKLVVSILFGILGFALNFNEFQLYLNITVIFGSIPGLIVALSYGPIYGFLTSIISFSSIFFTQQELYLLFLFPFEAVFIGFLTQKGIHSIISILIFWIFIGDVFVYIIARKTMQLSDVTALILVTKHIKNSIFTCQWKTGIA